MKKILFLFATTVVMNAAVNAQSDMVVKNDLKKLHGEEKVIKNEIKGDKKELKNLEGNEVSYQAKQAFYRDFGDMPGTTWTRSTYFDEATFTKDGQRMIAYYDFDAQLVGTTMHKKFSDLPPSAQHYINKKYRRYNKDDVIFFDDNQFNENDMYLYGSQFDDEDNYFVVLKKDNQTIILQVNTNGNVRFFKKM
ncbi:hypothetical protein OCK74_21805 [Chitinophagaceae bacterium LB-8]|uniref:Uncharacterized protein n=1 Tax=Paraflavisolibacter caeni TaxID=2982496 RepID=A0A9X2XZJ4_9BACT|nr:hypothetical protein [Paraflavisolibacter caeni]MCU7551772.1 hypothetical protein [Paraflavisolibacter caeni]